MGISTTLSLVDTSINLIKKFKSSKSYWSVSYLILLFTIREAIAWKFGNQILQFSQQKIETNLFPTVWEFFALFLTTGGSIELVILGVFLFLLLSIIQIDSSHEIVVDEIKRVQLSYILNDTDIEHIQPKESTNLEEIKNLIKLQNKDEDATAFLEKYFGENYKKVLENSRTYYNFKKQLKQHNGNLETLIEEKKEIEEKVESLENQKKFFDTLETNSRIIMPYIDNIINQFLNPYEPISEGIKTLKLQNTFFYILLFIIIVVFYDLSSNIGLYREKVWELLVSSSETTSFSTIFSMTLYYSVPILFLSTVTIYIINKINKNLKLIQELHEKKHNILVIKSILYVKVKTGATQDEIIEEINKLSRDLYKNTLKSMSSKDSLTSKEDSNSPTYQDKLLHKGMLALFKQAIRIK